MSVLCGTIEFQLCIQEDCAGSASSIWSVARAQPLNSALYAKLELNGFITMKREHKCKGVPESGVSVAYAYEPVRPETWSWCLHICREATAEDLEQKHCLERIDDVLWETIVEISHCPYCGASLPDASLQDEGPEFIHNDYSGYYMEVL